MAREWHGQGTLRVTRPYGEHKNLLAVPRTKPQTTIPQAYSCIMFIIMTTLFFLLTVQELPTSHSANRTKCPAPLLPTPASERCPQSVQSTSHHHSLFSSSPVLSSDLSLNLHYVNSFSSHMSYMSLCTNHNVPHLVPFYTTLSSAALNPKC